ncbi:hypothetical protein IPA_06720 [Ignicoccus pacificus DSM 13166]|uniref:Uncharacterized protein n=1 Tax=Ignicoccus pacificus DSM 13166 TaxID=940294 RepID=A0A977KBK5_9CREN|nr:hypothetical protein IPA_06720 [Ignicoccus pacificus DSM 13166]
MKMQRLAQMAEEYCEEFIKTKKEREEGKEKIYAVERLAQFLAQALLDFADILATQKQGRKSESHKELAKFLISKIGHEEFLLDLAGFRNVLIRMYVELMMNWRGRWVR